MTEITAWTYSYIYIYIYMYENIVKTLGLQKSRVQKYFFVQDEDYSGFIPSFCRRLTAVRIIIIIIIRVSNTYIYVHMYITYIILWFSAVWWIYYYVYICIYSDQMMGNHVELISKHTTTILYTHDVYIYDPPTYVPMYIYKTHTHTHNIHNRTLARTRPHARRGGHGHTFILYIIS